MNQQEYLRTLSQVKKFRSKFSIPRVIINKPLPQHNCSRTALFGSDLSLYMKYLRKRNLIPVCDPSVERHTRSSFRCTHLEFLEVFNKVIFRIWILLSSWLATIQVLSVAVGLLTILDRKLLNLMFATDLLYNS